MPIGECGLCLKKRELKLSHLLPRKMFEKLQNPTGKVRDPVVITATITSSTSRQPREYFLCGRCEDRFNKRGEAYVLNQMCNRDRFRLLERLKVAVNFEFTPREGTYSGPQVGIDTEKMAYFALSVVWRAAARSWRLPFRNTPYQIEVGAYQERLRRYLLGVDSFPSEVAVIVTACTDHESQNMAYEPTPATNTLNRSSSFQVFGLLTCGIHFFVVLGKAYPESMMNLCCFSSKRKLIFMREITQHTRLGVNRLAATTRLAKNLQDID